MLSHHFIALPKQALKRSAPVHIAPATALTLPRLHPSVPASYSFRNGSSANALSLAFALVDNGVLEQQHFGKRTLCKDQRITRRRDNFDISATIAQAMKDFTEKTKRPKPLAEIGLEVVEELNLGDYHSNHLAHTNPFDLYKQFGISPADDPAMGGFQIDFGQGYIWPVGDPLMDLQHYRPGLGRTILGIITDECWDNIHCFAPPDAYGWAQGNYWMGEDDESMVIEEQLADAKHYAKERGEPFDREQAIKDLEIFTVADIDATLPAWASTKYRGSKGMAKADWFKLADGPKPQELDDKLWTVIQHARALQKMPQLWKAGANPLRHFDNTCWDTGALVLSWSKRDVCQKIYDDCMQNHYEAGERAHNTVAVFPFFNDHGPSIEWALQKLQLSLTRFYLLEELVKACNAYTSPHDHVLPKVVHRRPKYKRPEPQTLMQVFAGGREDLHEAPGEEDDED